MKLLTLNTHSLIEPAYEAKRAGFVEFIRKEQPDVFALQEVNQTAAAPLLADVPAGYYPCPGNMVLLKADNHAAAVARMLEEAVITAEQENKATVFGYWVNDPERYGVAEFDNQGNVLSIEEKPAQPKSNYAVVGLYFYPNKVVNIAKNIKPSARGELEITTVNQYFLSEKELKVQLLGRGFAWLDTGTHDSLSEASTFIEVIEKRQGLKVACLEGIALRKGWIDANKMYELAKPMMKNQYGQYLLKVIKELGLEQ